MFQAIYGDKRPSNFGGLKSSVSTNRTSLPPAGLCGLKTGELDELFQALGFHTHELGERLGGARRGIRSLACQALRYFRRGEDFYDLRIELGNDALRRLGGS